MSLSGVLRPGLIQLRVLDLDATLRHYTQMLGLNEVCRTEDGRVCLKGYDEFDHHSVVLRLADTAGFDFAAFKVESEELLEKLEKKVEAFGYKVDHVPADSDQPGFGRRIGFTISTGHRLELYSEVKKAEQIPEIINPHIWVDPPRGMRCQRFDHMLLYGPNIAEAERFCTEVLGMYVPEICNTPDGKRLASWITGSNKPHDLAFVEFDQPGKIHHVGFLLQDWCDVGNAADWMARYSIKHDVGPTRHAITRGQTIYFWDPSGNRNEVYSGGYTAYPDHPQRRWDAGELGKGLFYYEGEMIPSFLSIIT
ncbi:catechol 2,3-dioxygenase [Lacrimispora sphenoides]|jgi:catechol 2,3-dioxygenase|uniref:catechol 2,3-dioxygenase n=1 Tax=Lacrimispora sphenoides TaxID=29370 RepID=UPI0008D1D57B|nr:catechol 2,3-dioxygenase [Lacrimispora sphenoides]SET83950.1 catechol 2,3-dioxygenase [Lacrimispora sphenoides]